MDYVNDLYKRALVRSIAGFLICVDGGESLMSIEQSSPELWLFSVELSKACLLPKISYKEEHS